MTPITTTSCITCGMEIPEERAELGFHTCIKCTPQRKIYGVMEYGHKTGGTLIVTDNYKLFRELRKPANLRR